MDRLFLYKLRFVTCGFLMFSGGKEDSSMKWANGGLVTKSAQATQKRI